MNRGARGTDPASVAHRWVEAFNARDERALRDLYHRDATVKRPTWPNERDVEASLASIQLDFGAYPDGQLELHQVVVQDRVVVVEFQFEGTNTEHLTLFSGQEIPPTGRPLRLSGTILLDVDEQGLITAERQYREIYPLVEFWIAVGVIQTEQPRH
jgi:predicted ester cyclase